MSGYAYTQENQLMEQQVPTSIQPVQQTNPSYDPYGHVSMILMTLVLVSAIEKARRF